MLGKSYPNSEVIDEGCKGMIRLRVEIRQRILRMVISHKLLSKNCKTIKE